MKKLLGIILGILFLGGIVFLLFRQQAPVVIVPSPTPSFSTSPTAKIYTDSTHGFTFQYPTTARLVTDPKEMSSLSYIPLCDPDHTYACVWFSPNLFPKSNFQGAGFTVNFAEATQATCQESQDTQEPGEISTINGISFLKYNISGAAAGNQVEAYEYRVFHGNTCFVVATQVHTTTYGNYPEGSITRFTDQNRAQIFATLNQILSTFRFTK